MAYKKYKHQAGKKLHLYEMEEPDFRISASSISLVFKNVPENLTHNIVLYQLSESIGFSQFFFNSRKQKDGSNRIVIFLFGGKKYDIKRKKKLTVVFQGNSYLGVYNKVWDLEEQIRKEMEKGGLYESNVEFSYKDGTLSLIREKLGYRTKKFPDHRQNLDSIEEKLKDENKSFNLAQDKLKPVQIYVEPGEDFESMVFVQLFNTIKTWSASKSNSDLIIEIKRKK